jgi:hypothetical protein
MTPDWYEDLAERLIEAAEHADAMGCLEAAGAFRVATAGALDMATSEQDELEGIWQEAHGR